MDVLTGHRSHHRHACRRIGHDHRHACRRSRRHGRRRSRLGIVLAFDRRRLAYVLGTVGTRPLKQSCAQHTRNQGIPSRLAAPPGRRRHGRHRRRRRRRKPDRL